MKTIKLTKATESFAMILVDACELVDLHLAFVGLFLGYYWNDTRYDAYASVLIGLLLAIIAGVLIQENKAYLLKKVRIPNYRIVF